MTLRKHQRHNNCEPRFNLCCFTVCVCVIVSAQGVPSLATGYGDPQVPPPQAPPPQAPPPQNYGGEPGAPPPQYSGEPHAPPPQGGPYGGYQADPGYHNQNTNTTVVVQNAAATAPNPVSLVVYTPS